MRDLVRSNYKKIMKKRRKIEFWFDMIIFIEIEWVFFNRKKILIM
jgi:hypothetical protein